MGNELYHYGILGMRWGVRRTPAQLGKASRRTRKTTHLSDDAKDARRLKKKKLGEMSNAELRKLNERQQLERNYSQMNPGTVKKGLAIAGGIAAGLGTLTALYNNSSQLIKIGKVVAENFTKRGG